MKSVITRLRNLILITTTLLLISGGYGLAAEPKQIMWDSLIPQGWNPEKVFQDMTDEEFNAMSEETYQRLLKQVQEELDNAPVIEELDGEQVKIPGFIVPLEINNTAVSEFLLVPYYGACTHTPPPPANQIIYSTARIQFSVEDLYAPVWITGTLKTGRFSSTLNEIGVVNAANINSAYSMQVDLVEPYKE